MSGAGGARLRPPEAVRWIVRTLEEAGWETWAVGGAVRDVLAGLEPGDWDLATRARPAQVRRIFRRTVPIGIEHGTVGVLARDGTLYEVTTFRRDVETTGRHAVVEFADRIEDDLARRDFTVNAVAWHPLREELLDPYGGADDLRSGVLRTVGEPSERFAEDYLRVLRALRFAGEFGLAIEEPTWRALTGAVDRLRDLSPERVREELEKVLRTEGRPSRALALYAASGAAAVVHPEVAWTVGREEPDGVDGAVEGGAVEGGSAPRRDRGVRPEGDLDAWSVGLLTADLLPPRRPHLRLAALLHAVGAARPGEPGSAGGDAVSDREGGAGPHDGRSAEARAALTHRRAAALLSRLRFSNREVARVAELASGGLVPPDPDAPAAALRRWLARAGPTTLPDRARLWIGRARLAGLRGDPSAGERAVRAWRRLRGVLRERPPLSVADLSVDGRDLIRMGLRPGPRFGEILEALLDRVLDDPGLDQEAALRELAGVDVGGEPSEASDGR